jgi:hypothetical protein
MWNDTHDTSRAVFQITGKDILNSEHCSGDRRCVQRSQPTCQWDTQHLVFWLHSSKLLLSYFSARRNAGMNFLDADVPDPTDFPPPTTAPGLRALDGSFRCDICGDLYDAPVTISCGHCFCSTVRLVPIHHADTHAESRVCSASDPLWQTNRSVPLVGKYQTRPIYGRILCWKV